MYLRKSKYLRRKISRNLGGNVARDVAESAEKKAALKMLKLCTADKSKARTFDAKLADASGGYEGGETEHGVPVGALRFVSA